MNKWLLHLGFFGLITGFHNLTHAACEAEEENYITEALKVYKNQTREQARAIFRTNEPENEKYRRSLNAEQYAKQEAEYLSIIKENSASASASSTMVASVVFKLCMLRNTKAKLGSQGQSSLQGSNQSQQPNQQNQPTQQQSQQAQQQAQQAQEAARVAQTRADQARQGQRKTHDPAAEAHECIAIDNAGSGNFGAFKNTCGYKVNFTTCNFRPRVRQGGFNWSADFDCEQQKFGLHTPDGGRAVASHNRNTEMVHWFACKAPAFPVDTEFVAGNGVRGRCN